MIKSFSGQVVFCFALRRAISAYVGENRLSQYNIQQFLFACVSISLKARFKYTPIKKVQFGENFTVKCKTWDKIQIFLHNKANFCVVFFLEANFLVLQAKL